jgi:cytochrome c oxidase subunit 2
MKVSKILPWVIFIGINALAGLWMAQQSYSWMPPAASAEALLIDDLQAFLVFFGTFIFLGITGVLSYSVLTGLTSRFDLSDGPPIEGNLTLEIVWTAIPIALVIVLAGYSYQIYDKMAIRGPMDLVHMNMPGMETAYAAPLDPKLDDQLDAIEQVAGNQVEEIEVHAKQWAWSFHYPAQNVTSSELHIPVNRRIRLAMQTDDVIHGFYVPAFRLKQDIIPKKTIDFEFTPIREGKYRLRDSQFSGTYFAIMQSNVIVESTDQYHEWLAETATHKLVPAENQAYAEYTKQNNKGLKPGWKSVPPAPPPMVNGG